MNTKKKRKKKAHKRYSIECFEQTQKYNRQSKLNFFFNRFTRTYEDTINPSYGIIKLLLIIKY